MLKCIFLRKKLYDYLSGDLSDKERLAVRAHLDICPSCQKRLGQIDELLSLVKAKKMPEPSASFWEDFDRQLKEKLIAAEEPAPAFKVQIVRPAYRLVPAAVLASVIVLVMGIYLYVRPSSSGNVEASLLYDISVLDELDPSGMCSLGNDEESFIREFQILDQLDQKPA